MTNCTTPPRSEAEAKEDLATRLGQAAYDLKQAAHLADESLRAVLAEGPESGRTTTDPKTPGLLIGVCVLEAAASTARKAAVAVAETPEHYASAIGEAATLRGLVDAVADVPAVQEAVLDRVGREYRTGAPPKAAAANGAAP